MGTDAIQQERPGHNRLARNVVSGWVAHSVALVIGFIMPRLIDESIGQAILGTWDLGWSLLYYLTFSGLGMAAAITHDVARFSVDGTVSEELRRSVASALLCQLALAVALGCAVFALFGLLPSVAPDAFAADADALRQVGVYLGVAVFATLVGDVAQGILAGHHRMSWNEYLTISADVALALAMAAVVLSGWGIVGLALVTVIVRCISEAIRLGLAVGLVHPASFDPRNASYRRAVALARFSVKASLGAIQDVCIHQGVRILLAVSAGPAALAAYSRYQTLIRQIPRLLDRSSRLVSPIATALAEEGKLKSIRAMRARASQATAMMALPLIVIFAVFGDEIVEIWMGDDFVVPGLSWVLALMATLNLDYGVSFRILTGLNAHGRIALRCFCISLILFASMCLLLYPLSPIEAAFSAMLSVSLGLSIPHYLWACAELETPPGQYFRAVYLEPLGVNAAFLAGLLVARELFREGLLAWSSTAATASMLLVALVYWQSGLTKAVRTRLLARPRGTRL